MGLEAGSGVQQWVLQRSANVITIVFVLVLAAILASSPSYDSITALLAETWFKVYLTITLVAGCLNSALAGWQIAGDYARKIHLPVWTLSGLVNLVTLGYFVVALILIY